MRQIQDPAKIAILVRFIFAFLYTRIHIICARTWYCFNPCQLAKIWIVTGRTEMLFLRQNFIHKISYTPISKNPAKIRMLASHRKSQTRHPSSIPATRTGRNALHRQQIRQPAPALKQNGEGREADTMHRAPIHTAEKAEKLTPRPGPPRIRSEHAAPSRSIESPAD